MHAPVSRWAKDSDSRRLIEKRSGLGEFMVGGRRGLVMVGGVVGIRGGGGCGGFLGGRLSLGSKRSDGVFGGNDLKNYMRNCLMPCLMGEERVRAR